MTAQEWLEQVRKIDQLIQTKTAERARLLEMAMDISAKPITGMPYDNTGTVSRKMENAVVRALDLAKDIDRLIAVYAARKQEIVDTLEKLPAREYGVLHRYYIQCMTWEQVAEDMDFSIQHVWRIKKKALKILDDVILCSIKKW